MRTGRALDISRTVLGTCRDCGKKTYHDELLSSVTCAACVSSLRQELGKAQDELENHLSEGDDSSHMIDRSDLTPIIKLLWRAINELQYEWRHLSETQRERNFERLADAADRLEAL